MKKTFNVLLVILVSCALAAWGLTTVTGQRIINSTIDATPIGSTTTSTGAFSSLISPWMRVWSTPPLTAPLNSMMFGWNATAGGGEGDFVNNHGTGGVGGFKWYDIGTSLAWSPSAPLMVLTDSGLLATAGGFTTSGSASATGGFSTPGSISAGSMIASTFNGNLNGNASRATLANTASSLAATPSQCGAAQVAAGVNANGSANCVPQVQSASGPGGSTASGSFSTTSSVVNIPSPYGDTGFQASCALVAPNDPRASIYGISKTALTVTVLVTTVGSAPITYAGVDCFFKHN